MRLQHRLEQDFLSFRLQGAQRFDRHGLFFRSRGHQPRLPEHLVRRSFPRARGRSERAVAGRAVDRVQQSLHALPDRSVFHVRRPRQRLRARRRRRHDRDQAAGQGRRGPGPHLRGDTRRRREPGRPHVNHDDPGPGRAGGDAGRSLPPGRAESVAGCVYGSARNGHPGRRPHRNRRAGKSPRPRPSRRRRVHHRLGQDQRRAPRIRFRRRGHHESGAGAAQQDDPAQPEFRDAEPVHRLQNAQAARAHPNRTAAATGRPASGRGRQFLRFRRDQRAHRSRSAARTRSRCAHRRNRNRASLSPARFRARRNSASTVCAAVQRVSARRVARPRGRLLVGRRAQGTPSPSPGGHRQGPLRAARAACGLHGRNGQRTRHRLGTRGRAGREVRFRIQRTGRPMVGHGAGTVPQGAGVPRGARTGERAHEGPRRLVAARRDDARRKRIQGASDGDRATRDLRPSSRPGRPLGIMGRPTFKDRRTQRRGSGGRLLRRHLQPR